MNEQIKKIKPPEMTHGMKVKLGKLKAKLSRMSDVNPELMSDKKEIEKAERKYGMD